MENADRWFLELAAVLGGGYFLYSIRGVLSDFKEEVKGLKELIGKLFDNNTAHEARIARIEARCEERHREEMNRG